MERLEDINFGDRQREIETSVVFLANQVLLQGQIPSPVRIVDLMGESAGRLNEIDRKYGKVQVGYSDLFREFVRHGCLIVYGEDDQVLTPDKIGKNMGARWKTLMPGDFVDLFRQTYMKAMK